MKNKKTKEKSTVEERKILTDEELLAMQPSDLEPEDFDRYYALKEIEWAEVRKVPHKVVNGVPVAMTEAEIEEFNRLPDNHDEIVLENTKMTLIVSRKKYLDNTDKKMMRALDEGVKNYAEKEPRQKARDEIDRIKAAKDLKALEKFSNSFNPDE